MSSALVLHFTGFEGVDQDALFGAIDSHYVIMNATSTRST